MLLVCASLALLFTGEASARVHCSVDKGNGYVWFRGSDNKLWVCWWGGSSYLAGPLTAADCSSDVVVDPVTHYCWYKGTDSRLRVCWYGGGWNNGPVTGATCASNVCIDHNNHYIWFQGTDNRLWVCWYSGGWLNGSVTPATCHSSVRIDWTPLRLVPRHGRQTLRLLVGRFLLSQWLLHPRQLCCPCRL